MYAFVCGFSEVFNCKIHMLLHVVIVHEFWLLHDINTPSINTPTISILCWWIFGLLWMMPPCRFLYIVFFFWCVCICIYISINIFLKILYLTNTTSFSSGCTSLCFYHQDINVFIDSHSHQHLMLLICLILAVFMGMKSHVLNFNFAKGLWG